MNDLMPPLLLSHARSGTSKFALALRITRSDGATFGLTGARSGDTIDGVRYEPAHGLDASSITSTAGFAVDNMEMTVADGGTVFVPTDVEGGIWRGARFLFFRYRWDAPQDGVEMLLAGVFGNVTRRLGQTVIELRGLQQFLQQPIGSVTTRTCRARFADYPAPNGANRCRLNVADWTDDLVVESVTDRRIFAAPPAGSVPGDAQYNSVIVLLHCDGANGSTNFTDTGPSALSVTALGQAQISTARSLFGGASAVFDGTGDALQIASTAAMNIGSSSFTIEMAVWFDQSPANGRYDALLSKRQLDASSPIWMQLYRNGNGADAGKLVFNAALGSGGSWTVTLSSTAVLAANTRYWVQVVRNGNNWSLAIDSVVVATATATGAVSFNTQPLIIGGAGGDIGAPLDGNVDEFRFSSVVREIEIPESAFLDQLPVGDETRADDWYTNGLVVWSTGANAGLTSKVTAYADGQFTLMTDMPSDIEVGDTLQAIAGCHGRMEEDCRDKFSNVVNFQGEPHLPGVDALAVVPDVDV